MAVFRFFNVAAVRHLGFLKARNFNCRYLSDGPIYVTMPNFPKIGQTVFIFQDGGRPQSRIRYTPVWTTSEEYSVVFVQNLVGIGAVVSIICMF